MTNDIRILSVLRKHYEEKALSTNSREDAAIHNALLHAIKTLESSISIPSNATNGDVIKTLFPRIKYSFTDKDSKVYILEPNDILTPILTAFDSWWNTPYREGDKSE